MISELSKETSLKNDTYKFVRCGEIIAVSNNEIDHCDIAKRFNLGVFLDGNDEGDSGLIVDDAGRMYELRGAIKITGISGTCLVLGERKKVRDETARTVEKITEKKTIVEY